MKKSIRNFGSVVLAGAMFVVSSAALAQTTVESTSTTSAGTISEFSPNMITVRTETGAAPVSYSYTKTTTYVDENGQPVSIETVKSGLPVTVYYVKDGDRMVASKVIVRRAAMVIDTVPVQKTTTTTTTSGK